MAYKRLGALRRHKFILDRRSLVKLCTTFVRPMLEYSDIIWDSCSLENKRNLEIINLDAARILTGATKLCSTQKLYDTYLEPLTSRREKHKLCQLYKMVNELIPQRVQEHTQYSLRNITKKVREKSREWHNHKLQPLPDPNRKRKPTNLNKHKPNERTKSTKISSLFPKRGNRNTKRTEKHKNKMTHGKTYNKLPRRINHKATKSKTYTGTTDLERSVEQATVGFKALLQLTNVTLGPDATLKTEIHKTSVRIKAPNSVHQSENIKIKLITIINKDEYLWLILLYARVNENQ